MAALHWFDKRTTAEGRGRKSGGARPRRNCRVGQYFSELPVIGSLIYSRSSSFFLSFDFFFGGPRERCFGAAVKNERLASSVGVSRSATKRKWVETKKGIKEDATRKNRKRKRRRRRERMRSEKNQRDATQDWNEKIKINKGGEEVFVPAR